MKKRLSDTAALQAVKPAKSENQNQSLNIDVRAIDNGYVVRTSKYGADGYKCTEKFMTEKPELDVQHGAVEAGSSAMSRAVKHIERA